MTARSHPFDALAGDYDRHFSDRRAARMLRDRVHERLAAIVRPGDRVLEIGCGTGDDAVFMAGLGARVVATDASARMVARARQKARAAGLDNKIQCHGADAGRADTPGSFDLIFSNFGALNCIRDLRGLAARLSHCAKPGSRLLLVIMGRPCLWEILWFGLHLDKRALRRWRGSTRATLAGGGELEITYYRAGDVARALGPWFEPLAVSGLGVFMPTSEAYHLVDRWPRLFGLLNRLDARVASWPLLRAIGDHYMIEMKRTSAATAPRDPHDSIL